MSITYIIDIEPIPASRPRFAKRGRHVKVYHAPNYQAYLDELRELEFDKTYKGPISVRILFLCKKPRTSKLKYPRGDIDNFCKAAMDGLQPNLILNDSQVVDIYCRKEFTDADKGSICISIEEL